MSQRGFTLLEVMVAAALLSFVTAGAMAAFLAQSRATNTQSSVMQANDQAREAIRLIGNDVRTAAAGLTLAGGGVANCAPGTVPFDGTGNSVACLPPVFRSNTPMLPGTLQIPSPLSSIVPSSFAACPGTSGLGIYHPGYQLSFPNNVVVPQPAAGTTTTLFCPDDLVVLAVDDTNPLFMVQSNPGVVSTNNAQALTFAGTVPAARLATGSPARAGLGFDDAAPAFGPATCPGGYPNILCEQLMLFGGPSGAVLMNVLTGNTPVTYPTGAAGCAASPAPCNVATYSIIPQTVAVDLMRNNLTFGSVGMPARLSKYWIQPVNAQGGTTASAALPFVSANLVRSSVVPLTTNGYTQTTDAFLVLNSVVLAQGVVDMQVEFGLTTPNAPPNAGLVYVNSGGLQSTSWTSDAAGPAAPAATTAAQAVDNCFPGATIDPTVWTGVCFPSNGANGVNALSRLKSVRLNLTVRSGANVNTRADSAGGATAIGAVYTLQPAVQDIAGGNAEAQSWATTAGLSPVLTQDGAEYRQVSTEISVRNEPF